MTKKNLKLEAVNSEKILDRLEELFPESQCELRYKTPFQLLIATVLSAQTTDKSVNIVTEVLFDKYPTVDDMLSLTVPELEQYIKRIGLYRMKAKNIMELCKQLVDRFKGQVPKDLESLVSLPGVGRKTANVVLSNAFGVPAIAVDTHVFRVSNRLGIAKGKDVLETEKQLMQKIPRDRWSKAHHLLIWHGRRICDAKKPKCNICPVTDLCSFWDENNTRD